MHKSVMDFLKKTITPDLVKGKRVLEVGSFNENGTPRMVIEPMEPALYIGVDMRPGPGVDVVWPAERLSDIFRSRAFDLVVCTETLEHVGPWFECLQSLVRLFNDEGCLCLTARGPGKKRHGYPNDYWRFTVGMMNIIFSNYRAVILEDEQEPGVLCAIRRRAARIHRLERIVPEAAPCQA